MTWKLLLLRSRRRRKVSCTRGFVPIEPLENRQLFSALSGITLKPGEKVLRTSATYSGSVDGYSPAEIKAAYGFNNISFSNGTVAGDGVGQTIAVVDAFNDPNIVADLKVFDDQFGLAAANLQVVNQSGGSSLPSTNSSWASEIALDVEWAHAIAPGAKILLVETNSDDLSSLMAGVKYARTVAGVSAVSLSWGGTEGGSFDGSSTSQSTYDTYFTTPSGHTGITYVAASGDDGTRSGVSWPASSTNVLAVGGTSLDTGSDGTYISESAWNDSTGGYSRIESEPSYQQGVQSTGHRSTADVSYVGNPDTGFAVYDSLPDGGESGWQVVGGTSAGTPQWAALVAIADQGRAIAGLGTLNGATQTLPMLYSLYSAPGTDGYATYETYFNDVTTGGSYGGSRGGASRAAAGYDTVTGLGTPKAAAIVSALVGTTDSGGGATGGGSSGGATTTLPASQITASFASTVPTAAVSGTSATIKIRLTNSGATKLTGPVSIALTASSDDVASSDDAALATLTTPSIALAAGKSKVFTLKYTYSSNLDGSYHVIASSNETLGTTTAVATPSTNVVTVAPTNVDLMTQFVSSVLSENAVGSGTAVVRITNHGNVTAAGSLAVLLYGSDDGGIGASSSVIGTAGQHKISIKPGKSITLAIHFSDPNGSAFLVANSTSSTTVTDADSSNDTDVATLV